MCLKLDSEVHHDGLLLDSNSIWNSESKFSSENRKAKLSSHFLRVNYLFCFLQQRVPATGSLCSREWRPIIQTISSSKCNWQLARNSSTDRGSRLGLLSTPVLPPGRYLVWCVVGHDRQRTTSNLAISVLATDDCRPRGMANLPIPVLSSQWGSVRGNRWQAVQAVSSTTHPWQLAWKRRTGGCRWMASLQIPLFRSPRDPVWRRKWQLT